MSDLSVTAQPRVAGRPPLAVHAPASLDELASLFRQASDATLVPIGGGTQAELGNAPRGNFELVHLSDAIPEHFEHQHEDLTVDVSANLTIDAANKQLANAGQMLPLDPLLPSRATIGGVLATGFGGPLRGRYGLPRDLLLGATVMRSDGELVKAGGRVVKNVTGYDLMRTWCGSLGTLGVFTRVILRVQPIPDAVELAISAPTADDVRTMADRLLRADVRPIIAEAAPVKGNWTLLLRVPRMAEGVTRELCGNGDNVVASPGYETLRDLGHDAPLSIRVWCLAILAPKVAEDLVALGATVAFQPLSGTVRAAWRETGSTDRVRDWIESKRNFLRGSGGSIVVERMPVEWRSRCDSWGQPPSTLRIMEQLKHQYDPAGRLSRGRFVGGI